MISSAAALIRRFGIAPTFGGAFTRKNEPEQAFNFYAVRRQPYFLLFDNKLYNFIRRQFIPTCSLGNWILLKYLTNNEHFPSESVTSRNIRGLLSVKCLFAV